MAGTWRGGNYAPYGKVLETYNSFIPNPEPGPNSRFMTYAPYGKAVGKYDTFQIARARTPAGPAKK